MARLLMSAFMLAGLACGGWLAAAAPWLNRGETEYHEVHGPYELRIAKPLDDSKDRWFVIWRDGKVIHRQEGFAFFPGLRINFGVSGRELAIPITSSTASNLIVTEWHGGNHGPETIRIFDLTAPSPLIQTLGLSGPVKRRDLNGDGSEELLAFDDSYQYWHCCGAESPRPRIVLKFDGSAYRLDPHLGMTACPSEEDLIVGAREARWDACPPSAPPPEIARRVLDLIYGGQPSSAWRLLDLAWPPDRPGKESWEKELAEMIADAGFGRFLPVEWTFRPPRVSEKEAFRLINELAEVREFTDHLRSLGDPKVRPIIRLDSGPGPDDRTRPWRFYVGSDHGTHTTVFRWVDVDSETGAVSVRDASN